MKPYEPKLTEGGWTISQDEDGYSLNAELLFSHVPPVWPRRGDAIFSPPDGFSGYVYSRVEIEPLTSRGPWLVSVSARPYLGFSTGGGTMLGERKATMEARRAKVKRNQLESWPSRLDPSGKDEISFEFATLDYYRTASTRNDIDGPRHGIVAGIPAWCEIRERKGKWRIFSCHAEKVMDTDRVRCLIHITLELIGIPDSLGTKWSSSRYDTIAFDSI